MGAFFDFIEDFWYELLILFSVGDVQGPRNRSSERLQWSAAVDTRLALLYMSTYWGKIHDKETVFICSVIEILTLPVFWPRFLIVYIFTCWLWQCFCNLSPCVGILMLTVALFLTAGMGIIQEKTYTQFGKHPKESLFYNVR